MIKKEKRKMENLRMDESLNLKSENRNLKLDWRSNLRLMFSDLRFKDLSDFEFSIFHFPFFAYGFTIWSFPAKLNPTTVRIYIPSAKAGGASKIPAFVALTRYTNVAASFVASPYSTTRSSRTSM